MGEPEAPLASRATGARERAPYGARIGTDRPRAEFGHRHGAPPLPLTGRHAPRPDHASTSAAFRGHEPGELTGTPASNPWLAVDAGTVPTKLARELRDAWEGFVGGTDEGGEGAGTPMVRVPIEASWRRSLDAGVDPLGRWTSPASADAGAVRERWDEHPLRAAMPIVRHCLAEAGEAADQLTVVSDADGLLLSVLGSRHMRGRAADDMNFAEGAIWSEESAGTNAVGTALAEGHAVQVFAAEHFSEKVQRWTCAAAPVHDPEDDAQLGVIDITGDLSTVNANGLALVMATARAVESFLALAMHERDDRVRRRHGGLLDGGATPRALVSRSGRVVMATDPASITSRLVLGPRGGEVVLPSGQLAIAEPLPDGTGYLVTSMAPGRGTRTARLDLRILGAGPPEVAVGGRVVALRPRQAELLALLVAHPRGLGADALSLELYGESGRAGSVRSEVSRLRKHLGPCVETEHYKLTWPVDSDVARVQVLLEEGRLVQAVAAYPGPLLPSSEAPGIRRQRDELEGWLRNAVLSSGDVELLWAWSTSPSGEEDLLAWTRTLASLAFEDARRPRAAAHVAALRARD